MPEAFDSTTPVLDPSKAGEYFKNQTKEAGIENPKDQKLPSAGAKKEFGDPKEENEAKIMMSRFFVDKKGNARAAGASVGFSRPGLAEVAGNKAKAVLESGWVAFTRPVQLKDGQALVCADSTGIFVVKSNNADFGEAVQDTFNGVGDQTRNFITEGNHPSEWKKVKGVNYVRVDNLDKAQELLVEAATLSESNPFISKADIKNRITELAQPKNIEPGVQTPKTLKEIDF